MGRLKCLRPPVTALASRLGVAPGDERASDRQREALQPWRAWYRTARWSRLRDEVFARDGYVCQRSGQLCIGKGNDRLAPVANHKKRHCGDPALFWDIDNIETVAKFVHDSEVQAAERAEESGGAGQKSRTPGRPNRRPPHS